MNCVYYRRKNRIMEKLLEEIRDRLNVMETRDQRREERETRVEQKIDNLQSELTKLKVEGQEMKRENEILRREIIGQNRRIEFLERETRRKNLILYGIVETENENLEMQQQKIKEVINRAGVEISPREEVTEIRRIGKKENNKARPIKIEVADGNKREEILRSTKGLKNTSWRISEDYPKEIQIQRKRLVEHMKMARDRGNRATIRYNRLVVNGEVFDIDDVDRWEAQDQEGSRGEGMRTPLKKVGARTVSERTPTEDDTVREESVKITKKVDHLPKN